MRFTRARRDCSYPSRRGRRWSCPLRARSGNCAPGPRRPRSFPLYTSSPRRRSERRALKRHGHCTVPFFCLANSGNNVGRIDARFGAHWQVGSARFVYIRPSRRCLFDWQPPPPASSPRAAVGGARARTSPVTSLLCYGDLTPQKPSLMRYANLHSLTTRQRNSYRSIMKSAPTSQINIVSICLSNSNHLKGQHCYTEVVARLKTVLRQRMSFPVCRIHT